MARLTVSVWPEAARMLGVSRTTAYAMARRGDIPTLRAGRKLLVPRARLERLLGVDADDAQSASSKTEAG